jgi:hypothetical protein
MTDYKRLAQIKKRELRQSVKRLFYIDQMLKQIPARETALLLDVSENTVWVEMFRFGLTGLSLNKSGDNYVWNYQQLLKEKELEITKIRLLEELLKSYEK